MKDITNEMRVSIAWLQQLNRLKGGLNDMILNGRLTEADIPDDWVWLTHALMWTPDQEPGE